MDQVLLRYATQLEIKGAENWDLWATWDVLCDEDGKLKARGW